MVLGAQAAAADEIAAMKELMATQQAAAADEIARSAMGEKPTKKNGFSLGLTSARVGISDT